MPLLRIGCHGSLPSLGVGAGEGEGRGSPPIRS